MKYNEELKPLASFLNSPYCKIYFHKDKGECDDICPFHIECWAYMKEALNEMARNMAKGLLMGIMSEKEIDEYFDGRLMK